MSALRLRVLLSRVRQVFNHRSYAESTCLPGCSMHKGSSFSLRRARRAPFNQTA